MRERLISSLHNERIKQARRLRQHRGRQGQGRILIDGIREVGRALAAGVTIDEAFVCCEVLERSEHGPRADFDATVENLAAAGVIIWHVTPAVLERVAYGERAEGIVAVAQRPERELAAIELGPLPLVVVLDAVEKPGNLGAVLRTADGVGATACVVADTACDLFAPQAIRASLGTVFHVPLAAAPAEEVRAWLRSHGLQIVAARIDAAKSYCDVDLKRPTAIVLGSEAVGLGPMWAGADVVEVRLPLEGVADSLNVSVTAAVLLYEAWRQRRG